MEPLAFAETLCLLRTHHVQLRTKVEIDGSLYVPGDMSISDGTVVWVLREGRSHRKLINVFSEAKALGAPAEADLVIGPARLKVTGIELCAGTVIILTAPLTGTE